MQMSWLARIPIQYSRLGLIAKVTSYRRVLAVLCALLLLQYVINALLIAQRSSTLTFQNTSQSVSRFRPRYIRHVVHPDKPSGSLSGILNTAVEFVQRILGWKKPLCPEIPPNLVGALPKSYVLLSPTELEQAHQEVEMGGSWKPDNCTARHKVALVVPYRDRNEHLRIFLHHIHPFLQRQQIEYTIYIVEQAEPSTFNRGMLMNIGFTEAQKMASHDCFIFHDVDLLPEHDYNLYWCPVQPCHMSPAVDAMFYRLMYDNLFGGVEAFRAEHFMLINGFSNQFYGWGGEDDDLYNRVVFHHLNLTRPPMFVARYRMLAHSKSNPSSNRLDLLISGPERFDTDGLNSLHYELKKLQRRKLYTWIYVKLHKDTITPDEENWSMTAETSSS